MIFNPYNLESLNELPLTEDKPMLTTDQIDRLEICRDWLKEVSYSDEYMISTSDIRQLDYAVEYINRVLKEYQSCDYTPKLQTKPQIMRPSIKKRLRELVKNMAVHGVQVSLIGIVLMGVGAVFCYGADRIEQSRGEDYQPTWINRAKVLEGLAICSIGVGVGSIAVGVCVSGDKQDA